MKKASVKLKRGLFISFEGGEGVGKSTQVRLLADSLEKAGVPVRTFREPGGTKIGEAIRFITHDPTNTMMDDRAEALLFAASRAQLVGEVYKPLIDKNYVVIADRYVDSSYVYQGIGRELGLEQVIEINEFAINKLLPDITFLLDLDYREGHKRRRNSIKIDRMDMQKKAFYEKVHEAYHGLAKRHPARITVIEADQEIATIHEAIMSRIIQYIREHKLTDEDGLAALKQEKARESKRGVSYNWLMREK